MSDHPSNNMSSKEWQIIEKILLETHKEQKRTRRWGIFFKVLVFVYIFAVLFLLRAGGQFSGAIEGQSEHVGLVSVNGVIAADSDANANTVVTGLRKAFESDKSKAIILAINSPGGSPVQAGYINDEIYRLKGLYPDKKVYAVISDLGASGAYYIAAAADEIYADKASLVGSIGVVASGFGFVDLMEKLGVERRQYTAGEHKAFLDPFSPENESEVNFWTSVLKDTHDQFISVVKKGRGDKIDTNNPDLFSGLIWNGEQAKDLGLVDGLGSAGAVARDVVGVENIVDYSVQKNPLEQFVEKFGISVGEGISSKVSSESHFQLNY
ncbi:signal peptide peptidase SppA [Sessilibacter sp. MAH1]